MSMSEWCSAWFNAWGVIVDEDFLPSRYQRAQALVEELEAENAAHDLLPSARDAASLAEDEAASAFKGAFGDAGGLFRAQQLGRLLR